MESLRKKYSPYARHKQFWISFSISFIFLTASLVINFYAGQYATLHESNAVTDIVLSNIRVFDVDNVFIYGSYIFWLFIMFLCVFEPKKIPFTLKTTALFIIIRSIFISLTHIGPFPTQVVIDPSAFLSYFTFGGDLFFSGHTGIPFLMALIFWDNFRLRILFIVLSILFGVIVLMGHLHYSIDVLSAFFITYGIYKMADMFFRKDKEMFRSTIGDII